MIAVATNPAKKNNGQALGGKYKEIAVVAGNLLGLFLKKFELVNNKFYNYRQNYKTLISFNR